jgi:hypothetical protein
MEKAIKEGEKNSMGKEEKRKRKWGSLILNFLLYGGWILVVGAALGIIVLFSA